MEQIELVSIKIPRTGSESFGVVLDKLFPASELMHYIRGMKHNPRIYDPSSWYYADPNEHAPFWKELEGFTPYNDLQYIHNHVPVSFFNELWDRTPRITFMREPVSWLISCYWFAQKLGHIPDTMGIWDYVELDYRQNWMSMLMGGGIDHFDFIGFQETWMDSVLDFLNRFTDTSHSMLWPGGYPARNVMTDSKYIRFRGDMLKDKMFARRAKKLHKEDFRLYKEAKNKYGDYNF